MSAETLVDRTPRTKPMIESTRELHVLDFFIVLATGRRIILRTALGFAIFATVVVLLLPSRYTATTVVLPPTQSSSASSALLGQLTGSNSLASMAGANLGLKSQGDLYVALFHSRTLQDAVIRRFGLMQRYHAKNLSQGRKAFDAHSSVSLGLKDGLITVEVTDRDPNEAAAIANGYVEEFRKFSANLAVTEASQRRAFFQQQMLEANDNLAKAEDVMKRTEQTTGVLQIDSQTRALIESAASIRAQIVAKEVQLQSIRTYAAEDNPEVVNTMQQLAALQAQLAKLSGTDQSSSSGMIIPKGKIPEAGLEYIRKLRDVKYYEAIAELLGRQFEMAKVDEARQGTGVQLVDTAIPPDQRSFPKRTLTVLFSLVIGLFAGCVWVLILEAWRHLKTTPNEAERVSALRAALRSRSGHRG
jgi:uncharacterized protein involved in exopolysaccharide biosynthesis